MTAAITKPSMKSRKGFASLSPERRREIASMGGIASHNLGRAHEFTSAEAVKAGRKGGAARAKRYAAGESA